MFAIAAGQQNAILYGSTRKRLTRTHMQGYIYKKLKLTKDFIITNETISKKSVHNWSDYGKENTAFDKCDFSLLSSLEEDFYNCLFSDCYLSAHQATMGKYRDCYFDHCEFTQVCSPNTGLEFINCSFANCTFTDFEYIEFISFSGCKFIACEFSERIYDARHKYNGKIIFYDCTFFKSTIDDLSLNEVEIHECDFFFCTLSKVSFVGSTLSECMLLLTKIVDSGIVGCEILDVKAVSCSLIRTTIGKEAVFKDFIISELICSEGNIIEDTEKAKLIICPYKFSGVTTKIRACQKDIASAVSYSGFGLESKTTIPLPSHIKPVLEVALKKDRFIRVFFSEDI